MGLFESLLGFASQGWSQGFSAEQAQIQRDWFERMSNTAHQREVKDLREAGLNPILSANGQGASTSMPTSPTGSAVGGGSGSFVQDVLNVANNTAQIDNVKANTELARNQANTEQVDQLGKLQQIDKTKQDMKVQLEYLKLDKGKNGAEIRQIEHNIKVLDSSRDNIVKNTQLATQEYNINKPKENFIKHHPEFSENEAGYGKTVDTVLKAVGLGAGLYFGSRGLGPKTGPVGFRY